MIEVYTENHLIGALITKDGIEKATYTCKNHKVPSPKEILSEILKLLDDRVLINGRPLFLYIRRPIQRDARIIYSLV